jgi:hypothetical protein
LDDIDLKRRGQMRLASKSAVLLAVTSILAGWGCDNGTPSVSGSTEEATVKGSVTIKGKPATGGQILFDPSNINRRDARPRTAAIGKDGSYTVTTLVGENLVSVEGKGVPTNSTLVIVKSGGDDVPVHVP